MAYILCSIEVLIDHLNHRYLVIKTKLNRRKARWMEEFVAFNFIIIYCKESKNPVDTLSQRPDLKDDSELAIRRR